MAAPHLPGSEAGLHLGHDRADGGRRQIGERDLAVLFQESTRQLALKHFRRLHRGLGF